MTIAPLAVLGIANAAFSLIGSIADAVSRPDPRPAQATQSFPQAQESVWHQLGKGVDVRALTRDELAAVSQQLYRSGAIGLDDHAALSLDPSFAGSAELLTSPDGSGRVDWVAEFQARLARHQEQGDASSATQDRRVLDILGRLQAGGKGVTSIRV